MYKHNEKRLEKCSEDNKLNCCLYFVANEFARLIGEMAEQEFKITNVSPSYAFTIMLINKNQGISPNELSSQLKLKPSTITRFLDKLEYQGIIGRVAEGRTVQVFTTQKGRDMQPVIEKAWYNLYNRYSKEIGNDDAAKLVSDINNASKILINKV